MVLQKVEATMNLELNASNETSGAMHVERRPRQIILGCDGTNNTLTGGSHDTNVLKMIGQLAPETAERLLYYDPGVGSPDQLPPVGLANDLRRRWERVAGLANGRGIYENIAEAYLFLVDHYQPGDQIYIFGFSRGAFTARAVAGMVRLFGIISPSSKSLILTLTRVYFSAPSDSAADIGFWPRLIARRTKQHVARNAAVALATDIVSPHATEDDVKHYLANTKDHRNTREAIALQVRKQFASVEGASAPIHFIGVWDTVESVGIIGLQRKITSNGATKDEKRYRHIRHALSMDEHRRTFAPRLYWDDDYDLNAGDPAHHRSLRQRWFRGVHSDVGGGYDVREAGLSDQAYRWMLNEAIACGLAIAPQLAASASRPKPLIAHDACYDTPWWGVAGLTVRSNVTHVEKGREESVRVTTEGAANDPNPRIHSVWLAVLRVAGLRTVIVLLLIAALFCGYGWQAAAAMGDIAHVDKLASIGRGAMALELWQKTYFLSGLEAWRSVGVNLQHVQPAVMAMLVDFGLILAYSWLGCMARWHFTPWSAGAIPAPRRRIFIGGVMRRCTWSWPMSRKTSRRYWSCGASRTT
jgi:uncharacterized protein (DUF2235 family)